MNVLRLLLAFALALFPLADAAAGTGTIQVKDAAGATKTFFVVTDGSSNFYAAGVICDQSAAALCASVGTAGSPSTNALTVQAVTIGHGTAANAMRVELPTDGTGLVLANPGTAANWGIGLTGSALPTSAQLAGFSDGTNTVAPRVGAVANVAAATGMVQSLAVCQYNATPPTITDTRYTVSQCDVNGNPIVRVINTNANGQATPANSSPVVQAGLQYETIAASQTAQVMGGAGATGDYLSHCTVYPTSTTPGLLTVFDNTSSATNNVITYAGGTTPSTIPISIPVGAFSVNGPWKVTTGANLVAICFGKFSA